MLDLKGFDLESIINQMEIVIQSLVKNDRGDLDKEFRYDYKYGEDVFYYDVEDKYDYKLVKETWGNWGKESIIEEAINSNEPTQDVIMSDWNFERKPKRNDNPLRRYFTHSLNENENSQFHKKNPTNEINHVNVFSLCSSKVKRNLLKPNSKIFSQDIIKFRRKNKGSSYMVKCKFCEQPDHLSKDCPSGLIECELCLKCLSAEHETKECPFSKCLRCNKIDHPTSECKTAKSIVKCLSCRSIGHLSQDCLKNPKPLSEEEIKRVLCFFCGDYGHFVCPINKYFAIEDANYQSDDSAKTESRRGKFFRTGTYFSPRKEERKRNSCPKCAGDHPISECRMDLNTGDFDLKRNLNAKSFFKIGPSKLAKDKNFLNEFSDDDSDYDDQCLPTNINLEVNKFSIQIKTKGEANIKIKNSLAP